MSSSPSPPSSSQKNEDDEDDDEDDDEGPKYSRFTAQESWKAFQARHTIQQKFEEAAKRIKFHLTSGWCNTIGLPGTGKDGAFTHAMTMPLECDPSKEIVIDVGYEMLESLLRTDLTPAERALDTFHIACTLLHELAVCIGACNTIRVRSLG